MPIQCPSKTRNGIIQAHKAQTVRTNAASCIHARRTRPFQATRLRCVAHTCARLCLRTHTNIHAYRTRDRPGAETKHYNDMPLPKLIEGSLRKLSRGNGPEQTRTHALTCTHTCTYKRKRSHTHSHVTQGKVYSVASPKTGRIDMWWQIPRQAYPLHAHSCICPSKYLRNGERYKIIWVDRPNNQEW